MRIASKASGSIADVSDGGLPACRNPCLYRRFPKYEEGSLDASLLLCGKRGGRQWGGFAAREGCLEQTLGLQVFFHIGQVVIVQALGGGCAGVLVPAELLVHHG